MSQGVFFDNNLLMCAFCISLKYNTCCALNGLIELTQEGIHIDLTVNDIPASPGAVHLP